MLKHIGIVGCSAAGAALCYQTLCELGEQELGHHQHPEVTLHTPSLSRYVECLDHNDWPGVAQIMLQSAHLLAKAGAQLLICPDNTLHQALPLLREHSPLPWLSIADAVAQRARQEGFRRLGLLGTRWLLQSRVYPDALAEHQIEYVLPDTATLHALQTLIMDQLVVGQFHPAQVQQLQQWIAAFRTAGCDGVVLGCTELPLLINNTNSALPVLDSTRLLAAAALRAAQN